jgi:hypothetical protein
MLGRRGAEEGAVMTIDELEKAAKGILKYGVTNDSIILARAVLAMLPVVRAAEAWRDSHAWGQGELAMAIDEFRRVMESR